MRMEALLREGETQCLWEEASLGTGRDLIWFTVGVKARLRVRRRSPEHPESERSKGGFEKDLKGEWVEKGL